MNPQETQLQELEARVRELESIISTLYSSAGFDPLIVRAITSVVSLPSVKTTTSATRAVNEGGVATYSVMYPPDGFISIGRKNIPYIN